MTVSEILKKYIFLKRMSKPSMPLLGREEEVQALIESLYKKRMKNSILIGSAGSGKTAIIETFAEKIINDFVVLEMNLFSCLSGTRFRGDLEEKIENAIFEIIEYNQYHKGMPIILFIDEIHVITSNGTGTDDSVSIGNIVKPYLSKGEITIIGATTIEEYEKTIKKDTALKRRLSPIFIKELQENEVLQILNEFSGGKISKQILRYIYQSSLKFDNFSNPDISIEILDRCMAKAKVQKIKIDNVMIDKVVDLINV